MTRKYRGHIYRIEVTRPTGAGLAVDSVTVDGQAIQGAVIPPPTGPVGEHRVVVTLK